jgi:hypothetical protein
MATPGQPTSCKAEYIELAHDYCLLGATNEVLAGESMRHAGDRAGAPL